MRNLINFAHLFEAQSKADLSRSDVLRVLLWPIAILGAALSGALYVRSDLAVLLVILVFLGLFLMSYLCAFAYLLLTDKDALRSEKYSLHKLAIQQGLYGDSDIGLVEDTANKSQPIEALPPARTVSESDNG
ncbi:hypothetical protein [Asticcacaulis excentricus]|uniref:Uncharacterized protein n=1 Tax=Asticcacaulis excentricus (strain ATCC 15261 / DSM 4724 / KCTC 12464 / NCIMB 9791 / VKM B-1370 / CB 48) TaxID=573065 RepID=E8RPL9_ASTEC|nr:hypothetical protein [Asticcacaulis excentricus]ADU11996.1 hypothetical protein Astex_0298 [Asticcacaulis excentricus CB 48]